MARVLSEERFEEIFSADNYEMSAGDNAFHGLVIISKYIPAATKSILTGADHDVIFSVSVSDILDAGLTEGDAKELSRLNWMDYERRGCLACYV